MQGSPFGTNIGMCLSYSLFERVGRSHGSPAAGVSSRREHPQRSPAGAGIPGVLVGALSEHYGSPGDWQSTVVSLRGPPGVRATIRQCSLYRHWLEWRLRM